MGCRRVSRAGRAWFVLGALGVPELITTSLDDYFRLALELATDRVRLAGLRRKIVTNRETTPLFDSARYTRSLERAYLYMMADRGGQAIL